MKFKTLIILVVILLVFLLTFLYFYQFPKKVHVEKTAVSFVNNNPSSVINTSIKIEGTLYRPLFKQHRFTGKVVIDGYDFTKIDSTFDLYVAQRKNDINQSSLYYVSSKGNFNELSVIWFDDTFNKINIMTRENWNDQNKNGDELYIVSGSSYENAIQTQKKMKEQFGENFLPLN